MPTTDELTKAIRMAVVTWNTLGPRKADEDVSEFIADFLIQNHVVAPDAEPPRGSCPGDGLRNEPWMMERIEVALDSIRHADQKGLEAELDLLAFAEDVLKQYAGGRNG